MTAWRRLHRHSCCLATGVTPWKGEGLRDFFLHRDLGIARAMHGKVIAHLVKANMRKMGTGWHIHTSDFQIVLISIARCPFDYSPDMEYLEIVDPGDFGAEDVECPCSCRRQRRGNGALHLT